MSDFEDTFTCLVLTLPIVNLDLQFLNLPVALGSCVYTENLVRGIQ